jgi:hypothetical protein
MEETIQVTIQAGEEVLTVLTTEVAAVAVNIAESEAVAVTVTHEGQQGAKGEKGDQGLSGGAYEHQQAVPAAEWHITHPLGYRPAVTVVDSAGTMVVGEVTYTGVSTLTISFSAAFAGSAYLS